MTNKVSIALLAIILSALRMSAQVPAISPLKIQANKPSVYISFERFGKTEPLYEGESENRIWLRLHNNTILNIFICHFSVAKVYGDTGIFYRVAGPAAKNQKLP